MKGYFGEHPSETVLASTRHVGPVHFTTRGKFYQNGLNMAAVEGNILRFVDTNVPYREDFPLASIERLYGKHGEDFGSHIDGQFLLLFRCDKFPFFYLVNNRYQAHRLYYTTTPRGFYFASSLRELLEYSGIARNPHFGSIRSFLANGFTMSDQTQLEGVHKLLPADYIVFAPQAGVEVKSYWPGLMKFDRTPFYDLEGKLDQYEDLYRSGLSRFLAAKKPKAVGTLLSGGHDTSFVVAQATQLLRDKPLQAYTVTFPGWRFDEGQHAENVARKFGAEYHPIPFEPKHVDRVVSLILANEEPVVGSSLPLHVLAEAASSRVDTMLGGDGGDTLWAEYYPVAEYHRWARRWPPGVRRLVHKMARVMRDRTDWERFWELEHVAGLFTEPDYHQNFLRRLCTYRHFSDSFQRELLSDSLLSAPYAKSRVEIPFTNENFGEALIEGKLFNGFFTYQAFHTARSAEYYGMELFLPTVERDVTNFICSLPKNWINGGTPLHRLTNNKKINRRFHKKALARYFEPGEIYNRSFDIPWYKILRPRTELLQKLQARLERRGWFKKVALNRIFKEFISQEVKDHELLELKHHGYRIFTMLSLEIWCMEYLDGRFSSDEKNLALEDYLA